MAAILCADVVVYYRLMGKTGKATLRARSDYRHVSSEKIAKFRSGIVNAPGDSILADFGRVGDGVACAAEIQPGPLLCLL